jgi:7-cyano-7-deazaguanine synthase
VKLLLLSGGLDSTAIAAMTRPDHCLNINYGQVAARAEERAARHIAGLLDLSFTAIQVPAGAVGSGLMTTGTDPVLPSVRTTAPEWWPFRNQLLITVAAAWGVVRGFTVVQVGTLATDGVRHADGTRAFLDAVDHLLALQEGHLRVEAPAATMTAVELLHASGVSEAVLGWTHSCHRADLPCANCPGCVKHAETLDAAGLLR